MRVLQICVLALFALQLQGQEQIKSKKQSYTDTEGNLYWNKELPVYLRIASSPDDSGQLLKSTQSAAYTNPMFLDSEGINYIRSRYAVDPETKELIYPKEEVLWEIYADGLPPVSSFDPGDVPVYIHKGKTYYGKGLNVEITSKDATAGVKTTYVSVNESTYAETPQIAFDNNGEYALRYYGIDHVGNVETVKTKEFQVDVQEPNTYYNVNGIADGNVLGTSAKIYLTREDNGAGVKTTYYQLDGKGFKVYADNGVPFQYLSDGRHTLEYYSVDHVENKESVQKFEFYFDKSAPITTSDILGDRFIVDKKVYFSGRTKMKLTAVDNKSGVKDIYYAVDNKGFESYKEPFYLPSISGEHTVLFYSLDDMGNQSAGNGNGQYGKYKHYVSKVYVDLNGPVLSHHFNGKTFKAQDTLFISPRTAIVLKARDVESGLKNISYSLDKAQDETAYDAPFTITAEGYHHLEIMGYDNVNNRNVADFSFEVDSRPPNIIKNFSARAIGTKEGVSVYPSFTTLYLAATDAKVGVDKIYYTINGGSKKLYTAPIQGLPKNKKYTVEVLATDNLGNQTTQTIVFYLE